MAFPPPVQLKRVMKFGKNLAHLSVPEWKSYNLDYNDLKARIRQVTQSPQTSLDGLQKAFVENFEYINLFVHTKHGELRRRLTFYNQVLLELGSSHSDNLDVAIRLHELHFSVITEVLVELKKLTKYILIQKIALKKIFKKLVKYHPDARASRALVARLHDWLAANPTSFVQTDLLGVAHELATVLAAVELEQVAILRLVGDEMPAHRSSVGLADLDPVDTNVFAPLEGAVSLVARFDLTAIVKKNFHLDFLLPADANATHDLLLHLCVYVGFDRLHADSTSVAYVFLTGEDTTVSPSYIVAHENQALALLVLFTGGLRNYLYCVLPNEVAQHLLRVCAGDEGALKERVRAFVAGGVSKMARKTVEAVTGVTPKGPGHHPGLKPSLKLVARRLRFYLLRHDADAASHEDYLVTVDHDICTANEFPLDLSFEVPEADPFPLNHLMVHLNDLHLHAFEQLVKTSVDDGTLLVLYQLQLLRKLPPRVQQLVKNLACTLHLFKDFLFYEYMRLCYFNEIPEGRFADNHYHYLLNLNLYKGWEDVERAATQLEADARLIQSKLDLLLKRQHSFRLLKLSHDLAHPQTGHLVEVSPETGGALLLRPPPVANRPLTMSVNLTRFLVFTGAVVGLDLDDTVASDVPHADNYMLYLAMRTADDRLWIGGAVAAAVRIKAQVWAQPHKPQLLLPYYGHGFALDLEANYDLFNDDLALFCRENDFQRQYAHDHDTVLACVYFLLFCVSVFISGIDIGIIYLLLKAEDEDLVFRFLNNLGVTVVLVGGLVLSLLLSMAGISLCLQRETPAPASHSAILWAGFCAVCLLAVWLAVVIMEG